MRLVKKLEALVNATRWFVALASNEVLFILTIK